MCNGDRRLLKDSRGVAIRSYQDRGGETQKGQTPPPNSKEQHKKQKQKKKKQTPKTTQKNKKKNKKKEKTHPPKPTKKKTPHKLIGRVIPPGRARRGWGKSRREKWSARGLEQSVHIPHKEKKSQGVLKKRQDAIKQTRQKKNVRENIDEEGKLKGKGKVRC